MCGLCASGTVPTTSPTPTSLRPRQELAISIEVWSANVRAKRRVRRLEHGLACRIQVFVPAGRPVMHMLAPVSAKGVFFYRVARRMKCHVSRGVPPQDRAPVVFSRPRESLRGPDNHPCEKRASTELTRRKDIARVSWKRNLSDANARHAARPQ